MPTATQRIKWGTFSPKHLQYMQRAMKSDFCVAEGAIRAGKTIDNCYIAYKYLMTTPDRFHLASGSTLANAKMNIGICNGFGLEALFRGRCRWGKYRDNEALYVQTPTGEKIILFVGGGKSDSYKKILGYSLGLWIATEINEHYDSSDSKTSFVKVALGRQVAAAMPMRIWDLNPSSPQSPIYSQYIDHYREMNRPGYLYEHFTIDDNWSLSEQRREEIKRDYDPSSIWYKRDILGMRVVAEGLIYRSFADDPDAWCISRDQLKERYYDEKNKRWKFQSIYNGVDFGGSGSAHTFVSVGITPDWQLIGLRSERIDAHQVDTEQLTEKFLAFEKVISDTYGRIDCTYCDSAEQTIINSFRKKAKYPVANARKCEIRDRIRATDIMMALHVLTIVREDCQTLITALSTCVWDKEKPEAWIRLDNGTSDIDTLDAFEYSWERLIKILIKEDK